MFELAAEDVDRNIDRKKMFGIMKVHCIICMAYYVQVIFFLIKSHSCQQCCTVKSNPLYNYL